MKEELKIGDLIRFDDTFRSTMMGTATKTPPLFSTNAPTYPAVTYMTNFTKYKNGIALIIDIISNKEYYEYDDHDIFKIILNSEVRYLYRGDIRYVKKIS